MCGRARVFCIVSVLILMNNVVVGTVSLRETFIVQRTNYVRENHGIFHRRGC